MPPIEAALTIEPPPDSDISGNVYDGVNDELGSVTVTRSTLSGNGGAAISLGEQSGTITVTDSVISGNRSGLSHDYAVELPWRTGRLIATSLRLDGNSGALPSGITRSTGALYLLGCWVRYLQGTT